MRHLILSFLFVTALMAADCPSEIRTVSGNFADDLIGTPDTRPGTWGTAEAVMHSVQFHPPEGCAVKIWSITGDLVAWVRSWSYYKAGVLVGIHRILWNGRNPWAACDYCTEDVILYRQLGVDGFRAYTTEFDRHFKQGMMVGPDNQLRFKHAVWLNETGQAVHMETTWMIEFQWVAAPTEDTNE